MRPRLLIAVAATLVWIASVGVAAAQPPSECQVVAQLDALRWDEIRRGLRAERPGHAFSHYVDGELAGAPSPWPRKADDTLWTGVRLWVTSQGKSASVPTPCSSSLRSAGLLIDPGHGRRAQALVGRQEVASYSRVRVAPGGRWALVERRICIPDPHNGPVDRVSAVLLAKSGGRWKPVATSTSGRQVAMAYYKGRPSLCTRGERSHPPQTTVGGRAS